MQSLKFLNSKERRDVISSINELYGFSGMLDGALLENAKEKLYLLVASEFFEKSLDKELRIDRVGLYIGTRTTSGIRLSVEGSQLVGPYATKHIIILTARHLEDWVKGHDFLLEEEELRQTDGDGLYIMKHGDDFLGCGILKDNKVQNCLSKIRRVKNLNI